MIIHRTVAEVRRTEPIALGDTELGTPLTNRITQSSEAGSCHVVDPVTLTSSGSADKSESTFMG